MASPDSARPAVHASQRTVRAMFPQVYLAFGLQHGITPDELCSAAGVPLSELGDRDKHVPYAWARAVFDALAARLPQLCLGLELGHFSGLETQGYLGQAVATSPTMLDALKLFARSIQLQDSAYRDCTQLVEAGDWVELRVPTLADDPPDFIEMGFANTLFIARIAFPGARMFEVRFAHVRAPELRARFEAFFACPVRFGAQTHSLVMERKSLLAPNPTADATAFLHIERYLTQLASEQAEPFVAVVARTLEARIGRNRISQARIAKDLGLSSRTLQRQLKLHGVTFRELLSVARRALATRLLDERQLSIYQVAAAAGYDDVSTFNRAFRRWLGVSPSAYRNERTGQDQIRQARAASQ